MSRDTATPQEQPPLGRGDEWVVVTELREGDLVDLEGDAYADDGEHPTLEFEYALVVGPNERETDECYRVDFDHDSVGFPIDHRVIRYTPS